MLNFEVINELTLKVTCTGNDILYTKKGAFIAGESQGAKNYKFDKVLFGPQGSMGQAILGNLVRRVTGENLPLAKVMYNGNSTTFFADHGRHIIVYHLNPGEMISVESENILAFTESCNYDVRFIGCGIISQKGLATSVFTGRGNDSYVAVTSDGNPIILSNVQSRSSLAVDPDAVICWAGNGYCDPQVTLDVSWKTFIGQSSGESYQFEWGPSQPVTVMIQPNERPSGVSVRMD